MAEEYKPPEHSKYGDVSMKQRLADGVYMIASNALIKVVMVAQRLADRLLTSSARERGEQEGEYLSYAGDKASIPLYEMAQKGQVKLIDEQVRQHFRTLVKLFPDYLKDRGILPEKHVANMTDKMGKEYEQFQGEMKKLDKPTIIAHAREIGERQEIVDYLCKAELGRDGLGLLLAQERLLDSVYNKMAEVSRPFTKEDIAEAVVKVKGEITTHPVAVAKRLDAFKRELQAAKTINAEAVELNMQTPEGAYKFAMNMAAFRATIDPEMLARFAETMMLDFPDPRFYGDGNDELWQTLVEKRFFSNLADNFNRFAHQGGNGYSMTVERTLEKAISENEFDGFMKRARMARYIVSNADNPNECLKEIRPYCKERADMIRDVQNIIDAEIENPPEQVSEEEIEEEL
jgi:hypothetical protein